MCTHIDGVFVAAVRSASGPDRTGHERGTTPIDEAPPATAGGEVERRRAGRAGVKPSEACRADDARLGAADVRLVVGVVAESPPLRLLYALTHSYIDI